MTTPSIHRRLAYRHAQAAAEIASELDEYEPGHEPRRRIAAFNAHFDEVRMHMKATGAA